MLNCMLVELFIAAGSKHLFPDRRLLDSTAGEVRGHLATDNHSLLRGDGRVLDLWYVTVVLIFWSRQPLAPGVDNFLDNIKWMTGYYPPGYLLWKLLWKFGCPMALMVVLAFVWVEHEPLSYDNVPFPHWAMVFGWTLSLSPIGIILVTAIYKYLTAKGTLTKVVATAVK